jgi:CheY-like chemotaxis protein
MLTANVQDTVKQQALNAGAAGFLTKPYESEVVLEAIRIALSPAGAAAGETDTTQRGRNKR